MRVGTDLTRYLAIRRRNLGEDWQKGFYEIKEADCLKKRRVREQERERREECLQPLMVEGGRPGEVDELDAIDVYTGEVTPAPTWQIASIRHVRHHASPVTCTLG